MASKGQKTIEHQKVVGCTLQTSILYRVAHVELPQEEKTRLSGCCGKVSTSIAMLLEERMKLNTFYFFLMLKRFTPYT